MQTFIDARIGLINVFRGNEAEELIQKESVSLNGTLYEPGDKTNLNDFFNGVVTYLGMYDGYMQFQIGEDKNLFGKSIWANSFKKIDEKRIVTVYKAGTARDYIFKNGEWR